MKLSNEKVTSWIFVAVILIVIFNVYAAIIPEAQSAGNQLNDSQRCSDVGCFYNASLSSDEPCRNNLSQESIICESSYEIPFGGLFSSSGVVFIIIMAALLIVIMRSLLKKTK